MRVLWLEPAGDEKQVEVSILYIYIKGIIIVVI